MRFVTNDCEKVAATTGFDSWYHCLPPKLGVDQFRSVLPLAVVGAGATPVVVAKEIDRTNLEALRDSGVRFVFHSPYFSFDMLEHSSDAYGSLLDAVTDVVEGADVELDPGLPVGLHDELAARLGVSTRPVAAEFCAPLNHYRVPRAEVTAQVVSGRDTAVAAARPYIEAMATPDRLRDWLVRPVEDVLSGLDDRMRQAGIDAVLVSTPLNIQELTGLPAGLLGAGTWAFYTRHAAEVHVFAHKEIPWLGLPEPTPADGDIVRRLAEGARLGYEELDLTRLAFEGFDLASMSALPASLVLRRWRESRAWEDVAYYVMASHVTRAGIDAAMRLASDGGKKEASELDAYECYRAKIADGVARLPIRVRTYFTHTHAGNRSHIPAKATAHALRPLTSLKIDAGLEVYDERGYLRAVSDITRSAVGTSEAKEFYRLLDQALVEAAIPACRPGRSGEEVFAMGMGWLDSHRSWLVEHGFCPPGQRSLGEMFGRDIGHLLSKQEPATVVLEKGCTEVFEPGMVAAAELQWPYRNYCVGVEDIFLVTEDEPVNLTRTG